MHLVFPDPSFCFHRMMPFKLDCTYMVHFYVSFQCNIIVSA